MPEVQNTKPPRSFVFCFLFFQDRVSLYSLGCPGTHSVEQAGLELRNPPASTSQSARITGVRHHRPASLNFFVVVFLVFVFCLDLVFSRQGFSV